MPLFIVTMVETGQRKVTYKVEAPSRESVGDIPVDQMELVEHGEFTPTDSWMDEVEEG